MLSAAKILGGGACPVCGGMIEASTVLTCRRCWLLIPTNDRVQLAGMHRARQDTASKLQKCVRLAKAKLAKSKPTPA